jgi:hypothetical protein
VGIWWELYENERILMGTIWKLDGKSSPKPFKKIRNIAWGQGMFAPPNWLTPSKNKKHWRSSHALS